MKLRTLNDTEKETLEKVLERRHSVFGKTYIPKTEIKVAFQHQDRFTVATLRVGKQLFVGTSKRMPKDKDMPQVGELIALSRATQAEGIEV